MSIQQEPDYKTFEDSIIDIIKEEQIKLGYHRETIRLYYPMESINHILGTDFSMKELQAVLDKFCLYVKARLGEVKHSNKEARFCIMIPPEGVTYVHEEVEEKAFLREFIAKIQEHGVVLEDFLEVFRRHSEKVRCEKIGDDEFDYVIYFEDGQPDEYRYCIKFEDFHTIYHRFTKADYESFGYN